MAKDNLLFKLDNLEYQYHYANGDLADFKPRLGNTGKFYNAKGKKSSKKANKILSELELDQVTEQLKALRLQIFNQKVYHLEKNLKSFLLKNLTQYRPKKNSKTDFTALIAKIRNEYGFEKFTELVCKSKAIKLSNAKIVPSKKIAVPDWFQGHDFWRIQNDKTDEFNPSRIWTEVLLPNKYDQLVSTFMNNDKCRSLLSSFDSGMNAFLGINREDKGSKAADVAELNEEDTTVAGQAKPGVESSPSQNESEEAENVVDFDEDLLKRYDGLLGDSEEEEDKNAGAGILNPEVNYNEVTDEESCPEDDGDEKYESDEDISESQSDSERRKPNSQLPELMAGYYSGGDSGEDSDPENDRVARQQISTKEKKKNRRGQRARRKIWEKKYGRQAKHIQREVEKEHQDRKRRQEEYEERVAKRAAKASLESERAKSDGRTSSEPVQKKVNAEHPSWVAKKIAEEKLKNSKFQGRKITFD